MSFLCHPRGKKLFSSFTSQALFFLLSLFKDSSSLSFLCCYCSFLMDTDCIFMIRVGTRIVFEPFFQVLSQVTHISHTPKIFDKAIFVLMKLVNSAWTIYFQLKWAAGSDSWKLQLSFCWPLWADRRGKECPSSHTEPWSPGGDSEWSV